MNEWDFCGQPWVIFFVGCGGWRLRPLNIFECQTRNKPAKDIGACLGARSKHCCIDKSVGCFMAFDPWLGAKDDMCDNLVWSNACVFKMPLPCMLKVVTRCLSNTMQLSSHWESNHISCLMAAHSTPRSALKFDWGDIIATLFPWPLINSMSSYPPFRKQA